MFTLLPSDLLQAYLIITQMVTSFSQAVFKNTKDTCNHISE